MQPGKKHAKRNQSIPGATRTGTRLAGQDGVSKETELRYREMLDSVDEAIHIVDADLLVLFVNRAFRELVKAVGLDKEIIGRRLCDVFPFLPDRVWDEYRSAIERGSMILTEESTAVGHKEVFTETRKIPIFEGKSVVKVVTVMKDVTELKRTAAALRESEEKYRSLVESTKDSIYLVDEHYRFLFMNENHLARMGLTGKDYAGRAYGEFHSPEETRDFIEKVSSVFNTAEASQHEHSSQRDGKSFLRTFSPVKGPEGSTIAVSVVSTDITKLKEMETEIKESEQKLRSIFDNALDGMLLMDSEKKRINYGNRTMCNMLGYTLEEIKELRISDLHPQEFLSAVAGQFEKLAAGGGLVESMPVKRKDGSIFYADINSSPITMADKKYLVCVFRDITERREAEERLRESEARYKYIFNTASVSIWEEDFSEVKKAIDELKTQGITDFRAYLDDNPDFVSRAVELTKVLDVNDTTLRLYGANSKDEFVRSLSDVFTPASYSAFKESLIAIAQEKTYFEAETVNKTLRGEHIHILVRLAIPCETSRFKNILVSIMDITERKRAEDVLMERFRHLSEVAFDGVAVTEKGVFLEVNKPFAHMFGYEVPEMLGLPVLQLVAPECQEDVKQKILSEYEKPYELIGVRKDGRHFPIEACGKSFLSEGRNLRITSLRDITDRKKTEGELLRVQKLESLGVLAGGIAHDFNNILTAILGNISLAMLYVKPGNVLFERLLEAENASVRARSLTQQLLTFSKGGTPVKKTASIVDLIKESAGFVLRGSQVKCDFILADNIWPVEVDEGQMSQVIQNLVINADQAMPDGGTITVRVENNIVTAEDVLPLRERRYVKITIQDHGIGIPEEYLEKIFDPFFSTKQKGSGLGLATAYSIIKKHDGYITVESEMGSGTKFLIYLPASRKHVIKKQALGGIPICGAGKVLFMDDEEMVRNTAGEMLRRIGYTVEFARDGAQAIEVYVKAQLSGQPFDAIIMDLTIPGGLGGKETIKKLLEIDPEVKAIVSSGYSNDPVMADYKKYGFAGVIAKPYRIKQLSEQLIKTMKLKDRTEQ